MQDPNDCWSRIFSSREHERATNLVYLGWCKEEENSYSREAKLPMDLEDEHLKIYLSLAMDDWE